MIRNFPFFVAKRYLFSEKSHNVINLISWISVAGVAVGTMAFIVVLSVFNGFDSFIKTLMNTFDPDLKLVAVQGKVFSFDSQEIQKVVNRSEVVEYSKILEEQALLEYRKKQVIATMKGVDKSYRKINGIDTMIIDGAFLLQAGNTNYALVGYGIAHKLQVNVESFSPLKIYVPKRSAKPSLVPAKAFNKSIILPTGIFSIQPEFDEKYIILPLAYARKILEYTNEVSAVEIKLQSGLPDGEKDRIRDELQKIVGNDYKIMNRYQQHPLLYKIMKSEKWAIFMILSFILLVASFNIIGSLTMLIIEKKFDISILQSLGASKRTIRQIFIVEGWLISFGGGFLGLIIGSIVCWVQIRFGLISFPNSAIITAYPVEMRLFDFFAVFVSVSIIGFLTSWYPARLLTRQLAITEN
ncbi:MAG: hypothetical protein CSA05_01520 [Bacteroidia bacterium]|nr:MAG: hypothetical protein CSB01_01330 [Bacteroidia bacterium]PIE86220.1 MAG: hypothetical protein CSA05_01520 [Bacteroidia bacterium]